MFSQFLNSQPSVLADNCFLCVRNNLIFFFRFLHNLMYLVAYGCGFSINCTAGVLLIFKNMFNTAFFPSVNIYRHWIACFSSDGVVVSSRRKYLFSFQMPCYLRRTFSRKTEFKDFADNLCCRLINIPLLSFISFNLLISIRNSRSNSFSL